jgi:thiol-disulfide isomerase/thioredoxin
MLCWIALAALGLVQPPDAETRVVEYLKTHVKAGERVVVSDLYNNVFTAPDERLALNRLFNAFFKIPVFAAQYQRAAGRPPSLAEISDQFRFEAPGETDVLLRIMEADPRIPKFIRRDKVTGEIASMDIEAIQADPRFGKILERTIAGWDGRPAPAFSIRTWDGKALTSAGLAGRPYVVYFWFSNCPPCMKTAPLLVALYKTYLPQGLEIVGVNADRALELPYADEYRAEYARALGIVFPLAHMTSEMQEAYGMVSVFPTLFFVDKKGTIVRQLVSFQEKPILERAIRLSLGRP